MTNARFRELSPDVTAEMLATVINFNYTPKSESSPESLVAIWQGKEFLSFDGNYTPLGTNQHTMATVLADHFATTQTVTDPVTQQEVTMSAAGAVAWLKAWYDYQYNLPDPLLAVQPPIV